MTSGSGNSGGLKALFGGAHGDAAALAALASPEAEASLSPDAGAFRVGSLTSQFLSRAVVMGNLETGQVSVSLAGTAAATAERDRAEKEKEEKQKLEDRLHQMMLDRARGWSEQLGRDIAGMEAEFTREYGDAWREHMALEVLDPEIAQRREGESVAEYRARLEEQLKAEMLNADGSIKDEYRTGPYARWARWAEREHQKRDVDTYIERRSDPDISEAERQRLDEDMARSPTGQVMRAELQLAEAGQDNAAMTQERDARTDTAGNTAAPSSDLSALGNI